ncbi:MAG: GDSL-type esterase/lipase family protein [candidate division KSB1 bacterium]|nr:GDSL-type esterase/lipase family protein [candidate division KSB1 bacterium]MDZ7303880.1 GDSL-type esterase/lipase family protein [candidate division KSB1 bacterium]MDZ7313196.1 GDSL-type esterase/lipase family protein [candidate division KSB1 bacterium]
MRKLLGNFALSMATIACCFVLGEVAFRVFDFDKQLEFELDEELYWRFRPNQSGFLWMGNGSFRSPVMHINNLCLRGAPVAPPARKKTKILALGDSYTFGSGMRDEETFCSVLERAFEDKVEVFNAGVPGYGIFQMQRLMRRLDPLLHPQIVLLTFSIGDIFRQPFANAAAERAYLQAGQKRKQWRHLSRFATFLYRKFYYARVRLTGRVRGVPNEIPSNDTAQFVNLWQKDRTRLIEMANLCRQSKTLFVIMLWPQQTQAAWDSLVTADIRTLATRDSLIGLVDLNQALAQYPADQLVIPRDGHPSTTAHQAAGLYLADVIKKFVVATEQ